MFYIVYREGEREGQRERERESEGERERTYPSLVSCFLLLICERLNLLQNGGRLHASSTTSIQNIQHEGSQTSCNGLAEEKDEKLALS